jgi:thiol-disulfide isomerase/thioredoxin
MERTAPSCRNALLLAGLLLTASCSESADVQGRTPPGLDGMVMYGQADMEWVLKHVTVFRTRTDLVSVPKETSDYLRDLKEPVTIQVFMGTWCEDAQMHVPVLFRALREAANPRITVRVIGMDYNMRDRDGLVARYQVAFSPTFVVEYQGREVGRVIETPQQDAASDLVAILRSTLPR